MVEPGQCSPPTLSVALTLAPRWRRWAFEATQTPTLTMHLDPDRGPTLSVSPKA